MALWQRVKKVASSLDGIVQKLVMLVLGKGIGYIRYSGLSNIDWLFSTEYFYMYPWISMDSGLGNISWARCKSWWDLQCRLSTTNKQDREHIARRRQYCDLAKQAILWYSNIARGQQFCDIATTTAIARLPTHTLCTVHISGEIVRIFDCRVKPECAPAECRTKQL